MLNNYEYFLALAEELNITRAAEKLFISHQCLSKYLKTIEEEYGMVFFERKPKFSLTYAGRVMLESLREIQKEDTNLQNKLRDLKEGDTGEVRVGITEGRLRILIPDLLESFREKYPRILVPVTGAPSPEMLNQLSDNKLDMVITNVSSSIRPALSADVVLEEHLFLVISDQLLRQYFGKAAPDMISRFEKDGADLSLFQEIPFVMNYKGFSARTMIDNFTASREMQLNIIHEATQQDLHLVMAARDYAAAICLSMFIPHVWQLNESNHPDNQLHIFSIRGLTQTNPVAIFTQSGKYMPKYMRAFYHLIKDQCQYYKNIDTEYYKRGS